MNKLVLLCVLLGGAFGIHRVEAQQDNAPPPPSPPFVQEPPADATWKVTIVQKNKSTEAAMPSAPPAKPGAPHAAVSLKEEKITRMNDNMRVVKTWSDGNTSEEWRYQGMIIFTQPYNTEIYVLGRSKGNGLVFPTMADSAFPELDWLSAENYVRVENIRQKSAYLFQEAAATMPSPPFEKNPGLPLKKNAHLARKVWIDCATHLPVVFDEGGSVRVYEYADPPATPLVLSTSFADALEKAKHSAAALRKEKINL